MIELTGIQRVLDSTRWKQEESGYNMPQKEESFQQSLSQEEERMELKTAEQCEMELNALWKELSLDCKRLKLVVHPNVYAMMAEDAGDRERMKKRLSDYFLETSMLYPAITLARLGIGEVYITIAYNGHITYSKLTAA